jgi:hypothetical protein
MRCVIMVTSCGLACPSRCGLTLSRLQALIGEQHHTAVMISDSAAATCYFAVHIKATKEERKMSDEGASAEQRWIVRQSTAGKWCVVDTWVNDGQLVGAGFPTEAEAKAEADLLNAPDRSVDDSYVDESGDKPV